MSRRANGEGSNPVLRKDGRYAISIRYIDPDGLSKRAVVYARTAKEVREKAKEVRDRISKGQPAKDAKISVGDFTTEWIATTLAVSDRKESTKTGYSILAKKHIVESDLGATALDKLTARKVEAWLAVLRKKGLSESTIRSAYVILRAILNTAVRDKMLAENVAALVDRPKVTKKEALFLTDEQVDAVIAEAESSRYQPLFRLLAKTGLRRGEALALRWSDVDFTNKRIHVRGTLTRVNGELTVTDPKTTKSRRTPPLSPEVEAILRSVKARQAEERLAAGSAWTETSFVFTTEFGQPCDPRNALRAFKAAAKRAKVPEAGLHTLRHSGATTLLLQGVPLKVVSELWGHSSTAITGDIYGHVTDEAAVKAMAALGGATG